MTQVAGTDDDNDLLGHPFMTAKPDLDAQDIRVLELAIQAPGSVVVASGKDASDWASQAKTFAASAQVEMIEQGPAVAETLTQRGIRHVFVMHHSGGGFAGMIENLEPMLRYSRIDVILFGDFDTRAELPAAAARLTSHGYRLFGVQDGDLGPEFSFWIEGLAYRRFVAVQQRVADLVLFSERRVLDIATLCGRFGIEINGLLHLGAHEGQELASYRQMGHFPVVLVEAHPDIFQRLAERVSSFPDVFPVHAAVAERDGPITLHVSANDQSSSVLPIGAMTRLIPSTAEQGTIDVPGRSLDSLFAEWRLENPQAVLINIMVSDIQGAELLALRGGMASLPQFDAIILELSFDDLYTGCGQVEEIDQFMDDAGFTRIATVSTWHPSWSDAFYLRRR